MNEQDIEHAAEIVGAMKDLFREFERQMGEIVSAQRIASSEARAEGAQVAKDLHELRSSARILGKPNPRSLPLVSFNAHAKSAPPGSAHPSPARNTVPAPWPPCP